MKQSLNTYERNSNVVSISDSRELPRTLVCRSFISAYAELLSKEGQIPKLDESSARLFEQDPFYCDFIEIVSPDRSRYTHASDRMNGRTRATLTGSDHFGFIEEMNRPLVRKLFWQMTRIPCGCFCEYDQIYNDGLSVRLESVAMPFSSPQRYGNPVLVVANQVIAPNLLSIVDPPENLFVNIVISRTIIDIGKGAVTDHTDIVRYLEL